MIKNPVLLVVDDFKLEDSFGAIAEEFRSRGVNVLRGPKTIPGTKRYYSTEEYEQYFKEADIVMFSPRSVADRKLLEKCKNALAFINPGVGVETIDIEAASEYSIAVGHGPIPENITSVAEFAVGLMIMLSHQMITGIASTYGKAQWKSGKQTVSTSLFKKKIGFIGFGRIAREVALRMQPFGVEMLAYSPTLTQEKAPGYVKVCTLEEVIRESDYLGLYVVINKETYNIINKKTLEMMKPMAYLINIARGEAVNEEDLYEALKNGVIAGAALDTYHLEPLPQDSKLRELKNVILTPHIAASTIEQYEGAVRNAVENITNVLEGKLPKYCKNPEIANQWYRKVEKRI